VINSQKNRPNKAEKKIVNNILSVPSHKPKITIKIKSPYPKGCFFDMNLVTKKINVKYPKPINAPDK